jgi:AAA+ ATPase superfamily predicted ATPase
MWRSNPYNYNLPASKEMFYGREKEIQDTLTDLTSFPGDSLVLIGGRRIGKTSLLEGLMRELERLESYFSIFPVPVFLDMAGEEIQSTIDFFNRISENIISKFTPQNEGITTCIENLTEGPPAPQFEKSLENLDQISVVQKGCRIRIILLLDECELLIKNIWTNDLFVALRHLLVSQRTRGLLKIVMAGAYQFLNSIYEEGSPLRNILKYKTLGNLSIEATRNLIIEPIEVELPEEAIKSVIEQSGGHPFLTQYLMHNLLNADIPSFRAEDVLYWAHRFPHERHDFHDWLDQIGKEGERIYKVILGSRNPLISSEIRDKIPDIGLEFSKKLDALYYFGLLNRIEKDRYTIAGSMFRSWFEENSNLLEDGKLNEIGYIKIDGRLSINLERRIVKVDDRRVNLTATEFDFLRYLLERPGVPCSRDELLLKVWKYPEGAGIADGPINACVSKLRSKIEADPSKPKYIQTEHGVGYKFNDLLQ